MSWLIKSGEVARECQAKDMSVNCVMVCGLCHARICGWTEVKVIFKTMVCFVQYGDALVQKLFISKSTMNAAAIAGINR